MGLNEEKMTKASEVFEWLLNRHQRKINRPVYLKHEVSELEDILYKLENRTNVELEFELSEHFDTVKKANEDQ